MPGPALQFVRETPSRCGARTRNRGRRRCPVCRLVHVRVLAGAGRILLPASLDVGWPAGPLRRHSQGRGRMHSSGGGRVIRRGVAAGLSARRGRWRASRPWRSAGRWNGRTRSDGRWVLRGRAAAARNTRCRRLHGALLLVDRIHRLMDRGPRSSLGWDPGQGFGGEMTW